MLAELFQNATQLAPDEFRSRSSQVVRGSVQKPVHVGVQDDGGDALGGRHCHNYYLTPDPPGLPLSPPAPAPPRPPVDIVPVVPPFPAKPAPPLDPGVPPVEAPA